MKHLSLSEMFCLINYILTVPHIHWNIKNATLDQGPHLSGSLLLPSQHLAQPQRWEGQLSLSRCLQRGGREGDQCGSFRELTSR